MKKSILSVLVCFAAVFAICLTLPHVAAAQTGSVLVSADGTETSSDNILTDWASGNYAYIKLYQDGALAMNGENIVIDLAGNDLTVTGTGKISAFDTANDDYKRVGCGTIINNGSVNISQSVPAPNGNRYVTVTDGNRTTVHRLDIKMTSISLRTAAAGLYYKATYTCDDVLAKKVQAYGVIVSIDNMPGADHAEETEDINSYTVAAAPFRSGITATSGSIFGIMKESRSAADNEKNAKTPIYANAYIDLGNGPIVADIVNPGKLATDSDFTGTAMSLYDVMFGLDNAYYNYNAATRLQLDNFYFTWKAKGMDWSFKNIGQNSNTGKVDNSDIELKFDAGTTDAVCPVCKVKVTWTPVRQGSAAIEVPNNAAAATHYYLAEDITYEGTSTFFQSVYRSGPTCFHLNGHNLTATKAKAFFGSSSLTNIMGNGIVTGYQGDAAQGAALQINNSASNNGLHVYGGTYKKTANSHADASVACIYNSGSVINLYDDVIIDAPGSTAIKVNKPGSKNAELGLFGCTVNGDVKLLGADPAKQFTSTAEFLDCTINGTVTVAENNTVYVSGSPVISAIDLQNDALLTTQALANGTSIGIVNDGIFTVESESVNRYIGYFHGTNPVAEITVRDNALHCGPDYTSDIELKFAEGTTDAVCPVCAKMVTWTPIYKDSDYIELPNNASAKTHFYLAEDVTYTGSYTFFQSLNRTAATCFHLNGHNLTATNAKAFFGSNSRTNIMGSGIVTGHQANASEGAALQINNIVPENGLYVYGGTYKKTANSHKDAAVACILTSGRTINLYENVTIEATDSVAIRVHMPGSSGKDAELGLYGCTVNGNVELKGADPSASVRTSTVVFDSCTINGTVDIANNTIVSLEGTPVIDKLTFGDEIRMNIDELKQGASIGLASEGIFTTENKNAVDYVDCFRSLFNYYTILVKDNALRCGPDYTGDIELKFEPGTTDAVCPVCLTKVTWTPIYKDSAAIEVPNGAEKTHYYLAEDVTYDGTSTFFQSLHRGGNTCFHLNGHDVTANRNKVFFGSNGRTNIMGNGVVAGYRPDDNEGAALSINNKAGGNGLYVYSGTYKKLNYSGNDTPVVCIDDTGSLIKLYEDVTIEAPGSTAILVKTPTGKNAELGVYGSTVNGNVVLKGADTTNSYTSSAELMDCEINGNVHVYENIDVTIGGQVQIDKLNVDAGALVTFAEMEDGSDIPVSAEGIFTTVMAKADDWLQYITCVDEGDQIIVRDQQFYQGVIPTVPAATQDDKTALDKVYEGTTIKYGDLHAHAATKPDNFSDGRNTLDQWLTELNRLSIDFIAAVNHRMSLHMYDETYVKNPTRFLGGSEPGTAITDSKAARADFDYSMLFAEPEGLENVLTKWKSKYGIWQEEGYDGYRFVSTYGTGGFTTEQFREVVQDVYREGGIMFFVHPKHQGYVVSDDPLDYYFGEPSVFEICNGLVMSNGDGGNMCAPSNDKAYKLWVDLLELGKKVWASSGSDTHSLPNTSGLNAFYTVEDADRADYLESVRCGNFAPGWVGIRMNIGGTAMGGQTDFTGKRLQFSIGDMYRGDASVSNPIIENDHTYRVQLYDDSGLLMETSIDPTQMNYFAIDCDVTAKFYRVVVWDDTDATRVGVSNPIWNTAVED